MGDREAMVLGATRLIADIEGLEVSRFSSLYETEPVEGIEGGYFINAVLEVQSLLNPTDLILRLKKIEKMMGRVGGHNAAREIDIDIITIDKIILQSSTLTIPHPKYTERAFVLLPLCEIAPDFRCPKTNQHIDELIAALPAGQAVFLASKRWTVYV